jgi:hypothetical protein
MFIEQKHFTNRKKRPQERKKKRKNQSASELFPDVDVIMVG